jgi:S1-C subfamily serine protease
MEATMDTPQTDLLTAFSDALAQRVAAAAPLAVAIIGRHRRPQSGILWRPDVVVGSEQALPDRGEFPVVLPGGARVTGRLAGRDPGSNIAVLRLAQEAGWAEPARAGQASAGALVLAVGADGEGGATARLGVVHRAGPAWHSQAGGRIDALIRLDLRLGPREEGGPVLDAAGALLGMSTLGPRGRALVIPDATIDRVLEPEVREAAGREAGLMVVTLVAGAPAAAGGVMQGDILLDLDGRPAADRQALAAAVDESRLGQAVSLRLLRAGAVQTLSVTIAPRP